jgi:hypothetical protein
MNLGLAIFLSAIFLGLIWLYSLTREKISFNFIKKIKLKYLIIFILFIIFSLTTYYYYPSLINKFSEKKEVKSSKSLNLDKPKKETDVKGLVLSESEKDVIFAKGIPTSKNELGYYYGTKNPDFPKHQKQSFESLSYSLSKDQLFVFIKNKKIIGLCNLGIDFSTLYIKDATALFHTYGKPDTTLITDDDLLRCYFYKTYNQIIIMKQNIVQAKIIFNPEYEDFFLSQIRQNNFLKYL